MSNKNRPKPGTPEFEKWINARAKQRAEDIFNKDISEELVDVGKGLIAGPKNLEDIMPEKSITEDIAIDKEQLSKHLKCVK
jgi:hypothetical protein